VPDTVPAVWLRDAVEEHAARFPELVNRPLCGTLQQPFELREDDFNRVQIRAVRRKVDHSRSRRCSCFPYSGNLVGSKVVYHNDVARL
jgi:hypothetical protein